MKCLLKNVGQIQCAKVPVDCLEISSFDTLTWEQLCHILYTFLSRQSRFPDPS